MDAETKARSHLSTEDVAAYVDRALSAADRSRVEAHLADCDDCRDEVVTVTRLLRTRRQPVRWYIPAGAAAAAVALLLLWPGPAREPSVPPSYREPAIAAAAAPVPITPRGTTAAATRLVWSSVPRAERYRLFLFDDVGRVVWETQLPDTSAMFPTAVRLRSGLRYFWKVEAQTGWNRWVASDLVEFTIGRSP